MNFTRRQFIAAAFSSIALPTLVRAMPLPNASLANPPLKQLAGRCGMRVGFAANLQRLRQSRDYADFVIANFNLLTPEGAMKWHFLRPAPDQFNFTEADALMGFAQQNGMTVHGHNLCWNSVNPAWLSQVLTPRNAEHYLTQHIATVAGRYAGKVESWDVVNEPVGLWFHQPGGLYDGPWLRALGVNYIDIAFHATAAADPRALRILNIHHVEHADDEPVRAASLALIRQMIGRGVPLQAVGIESHLDADRAIDVAALRRFIGSIRDLGLQVLITELDVEDSKIPGNFAQRDQIVAGIYAEYLNAVLPASHTNRLIFWTVTDKDNWLSHDHKRIDVTNLRPGLIDENMNPKPACHAVVSALQGYCGG